jgi:hypothetical protein
VSDQGGLYERHGELSYGWRCTPVMSWVGQGQNPNANANRNWCASAHGPHVLGSCHEFANYSDPNQGMVQTPNAYFDVQRNSIQPTCPDGQPNEWEIAVPNGMYMVTVFFPSSNAQPRREGCHFENVRPTGSHMALLSDPRGLLTTTDTFSVEVTDGNFTMSAHTFCASVGWIKLDVLDEKPTPLAWLPAPRHEWMQLELHEPTTPVGLVTIKLPNQAELTTQSFPYAEIRHNVAFTGDCRTWWLYEPSRCRKMPMLGRGPGAQPDLATNPVFPGYNSSELATFFATWDVNGDGEIMLTEMQVRYLP